MKIFPLSPGRQRDGMAGGWLDIGSAEPFLGAFVVAGGGLSAFPTASVAAGLLATGSALDE